jgi:hypothetical protein
MLLGNSAEVLDAEQEADLPEKFQIGSIEQISSTAGWRIDVVRRFECRMIPCAELGGNSRGCATKKRLAAGRVLHALIYFLSRLISGMFMYVIVVSSVWNR